MGEGTGESEFPAEPGVDGVDEMESSERDEGVDAGVEGEENADGDSEEGEDDITSCKRQLERLRREHGIGE